MSNARPERVGEVWTRREGSETAVYDPARGVLYRLNPSAHAIWELCDGEISTEEIVEALVELTGRLIGDVTAEVESTLDDLRRIGLVI